MPVEASFTYACSFGTQGIWQHYVYRATQNDYVGVIGDARVEPTFPCYSPSNQKWDEPAVLPANLQAGTDQIVQIGWLTCTHPPAGCPGLMPNDDKIHFVYICNDISGGNPCNADTWAGAPVIGHRYRFRVVWTNNQWEYSIRDITAGTAAITHTVTAHWHYGDVVWWGAEAHNTSSTLGTVNRSDGEIRMYWMQYYRDGVGWTVAQNNSLTAEAHPTPFPSQYGGLVYNQNYTDDAVNIFTSDH